MAELLKCKTCGLKLAFGSCNKCGASDCEACLKSGAHKCLQPKAPAAAAGAGQGPPPQMLATPAVRGQDNTLVQPTPWLGCAAWNMNHFGDEAVDLVGAFKALMTALDAAKEFRLDDLVEVTFGEILAVAELVFSDDASFIGLDEVVDDARAKWHKLTSWSDRYTQLRSDYVDAIARFKKWWPFAHIKDELLLRGEYTMNPTEPKDAITRMERTIAARQLRRVVKLFLLFADSMPDAVADAKAVYPALVKAAAKRTPVLGEHTLKSHCDDARKALKAFTEVDYRVLTTLHNRLKHFDKTMHKILTAEHVVNLFLHNPWLQVFALNEVNKGIQVLDKEIQSYAAQLRGRWNMPELVVIAGPLIESASGKGKQLEYYPLVCRKDAKITVKTMRCFDNTGKGTPVQLGQTFQWNKKDDMFRPIVVYDLLVDNVAISLGTVHTTPAGSEFERTDVWKQLDAPLKALAKEAQPVIICGDYYLTGEAAVVKPGQLTATQIKQMQAAGVAKTAEDIQKVRNVLRFSVQTKLEDMGWIVCQPVSGTNWKTEKVDEWMKGQIADFFICTKQHFKTQQVGIMRPLGLVVPLDTDDLVNSRYWRLCSDHFPVGGAFSAKSADDSVTAVVRVDQKAQPSLEAIQLAVKNATDPQLMLSAGDFEPEPSGVVPSNPDNPPAARLETKKDRKDRKDHKGDDDD